jgi:predicted signal transduction protein with EAL and GGDEF domain
VARLGGDEFAILISEFDDPELIKNLCNRVLVAACEPFDIAGMSVYVDASIGVVIADRFDLRCADLLRKADVALYRAKSDGRHCCRIFSDEMDEHRRLRALIDAELRGALASGHGLSLHYQPIYANADERLVGVEALIRWEHPVLGPLSPAQFLPIAEETGLIRPLGDWALARACRTMSAWPDFFVAVNLSPVQLRDPGLVSRALGIVRECRVDPARLQLEITESAIFNAEASIATLKALREAGIKLALDDFGTGYSSLTHLRSLEVDKVKIDRSFVQCLGQSADSNAIVQAVANIGETLGLAVTAEGVETQEQRRFLAGTGCSELQGYLFSRPQPEDAIVDLLSRNRQERKVA